jgi:hypothetical protein
MKRVFDALWKPNEKPQGKFKILFDIRKKPLQLMRPNSRRTYRPIMLYFDAQGI